MKECTAHFFCVVDFFAAFLEVFCLHGCKQGKSADAFFAAPICLLFLQKKSGNDRAKIVLLSVLHVFCQNFWEVWRRFCVLWFENASCGCYYNKKRVFGKTKLMVRLLTKLFRKLFVFLPVIFSCDFALFTFLFFFCFLDCHFGAFCYCFLQKSALSKYGKKWNLACAKM